MSSTQMSFTCTAALKLERQELSKNYSIIIQELFENLHFSAWTIIRQCAQLINGNPMCAVHVPHKPLSPPSTSSYSIYCSLSRTPASSSTAQLILWPPSPSSTPSFGAYFPSSRSPAPLLFSGCSHLRTRGS